jgi:hypothetical protein
MGDGCGGETVRLLLGRDVGGWRAKVKEGGTGALHESASTQDEPAAAHDLDASLSSTNNPKERLTSP